MARHVTNYMIKNEGRVVFCSNCGAKLKMRIPEEDNRVRAVCDACNTIHYENPKIIVGSVTTYKNQILLCRRAIEPKLGLWTLPAGYMELNESTSEGAMRETFEESGANITLKRLFAIHDLPFLNQVHIFFLAEMNSPKLDPGSETLEARLFTVDEIPWSELAFRTVGRTLEFFIEKDRYNKNHVHTSLFTLGEKL